MKRNGGQVGFRVIWIMGDGYGAMVPGVVAKGYLWVGIPLSIQVDSGKPYHCMRQSSFKSVYYS